MDCTPLASCIHGILQVRLQKWVAIPFPGGIPGPGIEPQSSAGGFLTVMSHQGSLMIVNDNEIIIVKHSQHIPYLTQRNLRGCPPSPFCSWELRIRIITYFVHMYEI